MDKIIIFDTTLRDGEQSPGASLNVKEKLEIARQLVRLKVDIIEAGFPVSSPGDFEAVKAVAEEVKGSTICALARAIDKDIESAAQALKKAVKRRIHTFIATSDIHLRYKLKMSREEVIKNAVKAVKLAKKCVADVEFSPEDAGRSNIDFLCEVVEAVIEAGARTVNIPDTVGFTLPEEFGNLIKIIGKNVKNINQAVISVHCHNDLGLAVANSLSAIVNGARQIECTINGIGERAGNTSLEEVVMAVATRRDFFNFKTDITTREIYKTSRMVSHLTGMPVQPNKAIVGANAFAHEAGIHQDGVLKEPTTYEIMRAETIGLAMSRLVLGKHSGRHAFQERLAELGYQLPPGDFQKAFEQFKELADKKKEIYDEDLEIIVEGELISLPEIFSLVSLHVTSGTGIIPQAAVVLKKENKEIKETGKGDGPIDAVYKTIDKITGLTGELVDYSVKSVTKGKDALGEVTIKFRTEEGVFLGKGASTDIIEASARSYLNAVNRILMRRAKPH